MGDGIVLLLSFLAFQGDGNVISEFNVGMCVWDDLSSLEESNVSEPNLQCLTLFGLWDFEILARHWDCLFVLLCWISFLESSQFPL